MDSHGYVDNFQPVPVGKPTKFPGQEEDMKFGNFRKKDFSPGCLVLDKSSSLAEFEYIIGFVIQRHRAKKEPLQVSQSTVFATLRK